MYWFQLKSNNNMTTTIGLHPVRLRGELYDDEKLPSGKP